MAVSVELSASGPRERMRLAGERLAQKTVGLLDGAPGVSASAA
jgi:hypothetical protein